MVNDYRYRIDKSNPAWDKALKIFDKSLKDLPDDVLEQLYEIFQMDVPAGRKDEKYNRETIKRLETEVETLNLKIQVIKTRSA